jgi:hypothetical protein
MIKIILTSFFDQDGKLSAKRCTLFLAVLVMVIMTIGQQFFGFKIEEFVYDSWQSIVITGCGFVGIEKYISIFKGKKTE